MANITEISLINLIGRVILLTAMMLMLVPALAQVASPLVQPNTDVVALVTAIFGGVAAIGTVFVSVFLPILANRQKRAEAANLLEIAKTSLALDQTKLEIAKAQLELERVRDNVVLLERNTNSLTKEIAQLSRKEGEQIGRDKANARTAQDAQILEEGKRQGTETERANVAGAGASNSGATIQAVTAAAAAAAAIAAPAAAAIAAPPAAAIAAPPAAELAAPPVVKAVVPPVVDAAVKAAFNAEKAAEEASKLKDEKK